MKSLGIIRKVDDLGRIVIPKETRTILGIDIGTPLEMFIDGQDIILRKYSPGCACCGSIDGAIDFGSLLLCKSCIAKLAKEAGV